MTPEELQTKRAERLAIHQAAFIAQQSIDLDALDALEQEHGDTRVIRIDVGGWHAAHGGATMVVAKLPRACEHVYKRFQSQVSGKNSTGETNSTATDLLAISCLVYPPAGEIRNATLDAAPGILAHVAQQIVEAVQGRAIAEGK